MADRTHSDHSQPVIGRTLCPQSSSNIVPVLFAGTDFHPPPAVVAPIDAALWRSPRTRRDKYPARVSSPFPYSDTCNGNTRLHWACDTGTGRHPRTLSVDTARPCRSKPVE